MRVGSGGRKPGPDLRKEAGKTGANSIGSRVPGLLFSRKRVLPTARCVNEGYHEPSAEDYCAALFLDSTGIG